ncbi:hypothetical protein FDG2_3557 [Candidatus Protofrankia californiensis]|uniref:Uncharacterized protein n=1 Tax=Candidatus Protofrankia californiensis TaxID=1839754 RepID=A0A1C3P011_9ACTN|nr:hypothetical protein FDG2_3557 [Candidatus Protofrankia californiensis]
MKGGARQLGAAPGEPGPSGTYEEEDHEPEEVDRGGTVTAFASRPGDPFGYCSYAHALPVCRYSSTGIGSTPVRIRAV